MPRGKNTRDFKFDVTLPNGEVVRRSFSGNGPTPEAQEADARAKWERAHRPAPDSDYHPGTFGWWLDTKWSPLKYHLEDNTLDNYAVAVSHIQDELGDTPVSKVDATALAKALNAIAAKRTLRNKSAVERSGAQPIYKPLSNSVINKCRLIALDVVELASESGSGKRIVPKRVPVRATPPITITPYTPQQMRRLLECARDTTAFPEVLLGGFLGLSINEARAVDAKDIAAGILHARNHRKRSGKLSAKMKTEHRQRSLPLPAELLSEILTLTFGGGPLAKGIRSKKLATEKSLSTSLERAEIRAGLHALSSHKLRHSLSSWLDDNGCPRATRLFILGQSRKAVADRYNHTSPEVVREWIGKFWSAGDNWRELGEIPSIVRTGGPKNPATGSDNGRAKLTVEKVTEIKRELGEGVGVAEIARNFNVSQRCISQIRDGITWKAA